MWDFFVIMFFIVSLILTKTTPKYRKEYNIIRRVFKISVVLIEVYALCFVMDILKYMFYESIKGFFKSFKGMS